MENKKYFEELEIRIKEITILRKQCSSYAAGIIGQTLFREDLFFCTSLDRCVQLSEGFVLLLQQRNLSCAGAILRLQMDNCMRTYAAFIAADKDAVIDCIIYGKKISNQKDVDGIQMKDCHLKKKMVTFMPAFSEIYNKTSGYIHFSDLSFYPMVVSCDEKTIEWQIGQSLQERFNPLLLEIADAFIDLIKINYKMLQAVVDSKQRYETQGETHE